MTIDQIKEEITEMRDNAAKKTKKFRDADSDEEFDELHYYNGQQAAINQVLSWLKMLTT